MNIEDGWLFWSADFSVQASGNGTEKGSVNLCRSPKQRKLWHKMPEGIYESDDCPPLIVSGRGVTFEEALTNANLAAAHAKPIILKDN